MNDLKKIQVSSIMQILTYREIISTFQYICTFMKLEVIKHSGQGIQINQIWWGTQKQTLSDSFIVITPKLFVVWHLLTRQFKKCTHTPFNAHSTLSTHGISKHEQYNLRSPAIFRTMLINNQMLKIRVCIIDIALNTGKALPLIQPIKVQTPQKKKKRSKISLVFFVCAKMWVLDAG